MDTTYCCLFFGVDPCLSKATMLLNMLLSLITVFTFLTCPSGATLNEDGEVFNQDVSGSDFLQHRLHPPFSCPDMTPSSAVPTSIEFVKAADVKVIAALGDSLTTAIGANGSTILSIPFEFRQVSWSIGGYGTYQNVITLVSTFVSGEQK
ncbi:phospholipase B1, membrane-associated-like [Halichoeres trimaculatus]|uniref:phospholipase B1, membrane-associated-like n=1 Tax=Halichoeres trimaculatus TaxID=147232 RepID=UPI003D9F93D9